MPFKEHTKITFSGIFGEAANPYEEWSFGLSIAHDDGTPLDLASGTAAADSAGYCATFLTAVAMPAVQLTQTKVVNVGPDGKYIGGPQIHNTATVAGGDILYPPQISLAVSLWSDAAVFPRTHGRFYIPGPKAVLVGATGVAADADIADVTTQAKAFLQNFNTDFIAGAGHVVIASQKGAGVNAKVTEVRVGHAFDTIRSRRRSLQEKYTSATV